MKAKIRKIGNSLGVLLPKDILDSLELSEGSNLELSIKNRKITIVLEKVAKVKKN